MIDDANRIETPRGASPESSESIEELHEEDAAADIDFKDLGVVSSAENSEGVETGARANQPETEEFGSKQVAELERQIQGLKSQLEERSSQYMRIVADFENYRKRTSQERDDLQTQIKGNTIVELLPVIDSFERARSQIKPQTEQEMSIHKSYQSVYKQFVDCLKSLGVSAMRVEGKEFDPNLHEAVMRESTSEHAEGTVLEEFRRGYALGERVLRHAMVKVATAVEGESTQSSGATGGPEA